MTDHLAPLVPWGKARAAGTHPLVCHVLDTAAVVEQVLGLFLGPRCRDELLAAFEPLGDPKAWIATLAGLHDLGKYTPSFQALQVALAVERFDASAAADLRRVQRSPELSLRADTPHGLITAMHFQDLLRRWHAPIATAELIAVALGGHHGHFPDAAALRQAKREINNHGRETWRGWRDELVREVIRLRGLPGPDTVDWADVRLSTGAAIGLAALTTISDWIASDTKNFPYADGADLAAYVRETDELAARAVTRLDLHDWNPPARWAELFPAEKARPAQELVEQLIGDSAEPTLLLVEAPTGEGKSKAALQAAAALVCNLGLSGTYVAMPTQATSNQLYAELQTLVREHGGDAAVQLVHSGAKDYLSDPAVNPSNVGPDEPGDSDLAAQSWFTRKKNLLATMGVGTVDQALKGSIRAGHVFVRLAALTNKVVIFDEIHAYETYMSTLLDRLLSWLGRLGVPVVLLSATLPAGRRQELAAAWQSGLLRCLPREVPALPPSGDYPRVTRVTAGGPVVEAAKVSKVNEGRIVRLTRVADKDTVDWVLDRVRDGGCAVVMHNLVRRAVATHKELKKRIDELPEGQQPRLILAHGKLISSKRSEVEAEIKSHFGFGGDRVKAIVVSTQVLEQGLDLDFDFMLTDLAPVDWIIQRAGRLHRHQRDEARGVPELAIAGVIETDHGPRFPPYLHQVYAPMIMLRTWALLRNRDSLSLPAEVPMLVDALYGPEDAIACPAGWEKAWQDAAEKLQHARERARRNARLMYIPSPEGMDHLAEMTKNSKNPGQTREKRYRR